MLFRLIYVYVFLLAFKNNGYNQKNSRPVLLTVYEVIPLDTFDPKNGKSHIINYTKYHGSVCYCVYSTRLNVTYCKSWLCVLCCIFNIEKPELNLLNADTLAVLFWKKEPMLLTSLPKLATFMHFYEAHAQTFVDKIVRKTWPILCRILIQATKSLETVRQNHVFTFAVFYKTNIKDDWVKLYHATTLMSVVRLCVTLNKCYLVKIFELSNRLLVPKLGFLHFIQRTPMFFTFAERLHNITCSNFKGDLS